MLINKMCSMLACHAARVSGRRVAGPAVEAGRFLHCWAWGQPAAVAAASQPAAALPEPRRRELTAR